MAAVVEVIPGPHRMVSPMTGEAVEETGLKVGDEAVCVVKATNVIVEIPIGGESRARTPAWRSIAVPPRHARGLLECRGGAVGEHRYVRRPSAAAGGN